MHKSKLGGFIIDCKTDDLPRAADFWSAALGMPVRELPGSEGELYRKLEEPHLGLSIEVQKVDHPSRVHLDIETDDIEAEVAPPGGSGSQTGRAGSELVGAGGADRAALLRGEREFPSLSRSRPPAGPEPGLAPGGRSHSRCV